MGDFLRAAIVRNGHPSSYWNTSIIHPPILPGLRGPKALLLRGCMVLSLMSQESGWRKCPENVRYREREREREDEMWLNLLTIENCGIWGYRESNVRVLDPDCHAAQPGCTLGQQALSGGDIRSVTRNSRVGWKSAIPGLFQTQAPARQRCLEVGNKKMRSNSLDHDRGWVPDAVGSGIAWRWW